MLCFRLKLLCYSKSKFRFPTYPSLYSSTCAHYRVLFWLPNYLPSHPNSPPWGAGGGGVKNVREKGRNVIIMLLFLFFSGLR